VYFVTTTNGHKIQFSEEDVFTALANTWTKASDGYAKRYYEKSENGKRVRWVKYFHREVTNAPDGVVIDHINQDKLDNRRENLRPASKSLNGLNSSFVKGKVPFRGVFFNNQAGKYTARITIDGKTRHLGYFDEPEEAHAAYLTKQKEATSVV